jgi:hypothetical protein
MAFLGDVFLCLIILGLTLTFIVLLANEAYKAAYKLFMACLLIATCTGVWMTYYEVRQPVEIRLAVPGYESPSPTPSPNDLI